MRITCHVILFLVCPEKRSGVRIQIVQGRMKEEWFDREEDGITLITEDSDCKSTEVRNRKMILLTIVEILLRAKKIYNPCAIHYISVSSHVLGEGAAYWLTVE